MGDPVAADRDVVVRKETDKVQAVVLHVQRREAEAATLGVERALVRGRVDHQKLLTIGSSRRAGRAVDEEPRLRDEVVGHLSR